MKHLDTVICSIFFAVAFLISASVMSILGSVASLIMLIWTVLGVFDEADYEYRWEQYYKADHPRSIPVQ